MATPISDQHNTKIIKVTFNFKSKVSSWIFINTPKISLIHWFVLEIELILVSWDHSGHIHFWSHPQQPFSVNY